MTTEVIKEVLEKLNAKLKRKGRKILLLMDNAPCHPHNLVDTFSNITIKFLPKKTTSMTQPLDAGIIVNWKVKYKKKPLRFVFSSVGGKQNASEIVKSVNVSMAIELGKQAWDKVSSDLIVKCFKKTKLYPKEIDDEDDPFEGEDELSSLRQLVHEIDSTRDALTFISSEDQIDVCQGYIDDSNPNWREEVRNDLFDDEDDKIGASPREKRKRESDAAEIDLDEYYDLELKEPAVKTVAQAVGLAEQLKDFAQYYGHEELSFTLSKVNDILHEMKLRAPKYHKAITDFFSS